MGIPKNEEERRIIVKLTGKEKWNDNSKGVARQFPENCTNEVSILENRTVLMLWAVLGLMRGTYRVDAKESHDMAWLGISSTNRWREFSNSFIIGNLFNNLLMLLSRQNEFGFHFRCFPSSSSRL